MNSTRIFTTVLLAGAAIAALVADTALAEEPARSVMQDVALLDGGVLVGQIVDNQGVGIKGESVTLLQQQHRVAVAVTDANGQFAIRGVPGGVYQLVGAGQVGAYRAWAPGTAPKSAQPAALLVAGENVVRGQTYYHDSRFPRLGRTRFWLANPWVVAGVVGGTVGTVVGITAADGGGAPASP